MASVSLPNNAHALFGVDDLAKATKFEQITQIKIAEEQQRHLFQMLETVQIASALYEVFSDLGNLSRVVEAVVGFQVPERFTQDTGKLSLLEYQALTQDRMAFLEQVYADIDALSADVALDDDQISLLAQAGQIAANPRSEITATQAQYLQDLINHEQKKRADALEVLKAKRDEVEKQLGFGQTKAFSRAMDCFNNSRYCK